ncbi:MAG TPA: ATP-binding protein [Gemmatimonadales bacterium]|jgi:signal transduction histidine kinase
MPRPLSLGQKLPLVVAGFMLLVGAGISIGSYAEVRQTALNAARQHIGDLVTLVGSGQRTGPQLVVAARAVGRRDVVRTFLAHPDSATRVAAFDALAERPGQTILATQLIAADGSVLLSTDSSFDNLPSDFPPAVPPGDSGAVGRLRTVHDSIVYPVSSTIADYPGMMVVQWRRATSASESSQNARHAIGATMLLGNRDGSYWTDFAKVVPGPSLLPRASRQPVEYTREPGHGAVIAGFVPLAGTPWLFSVEIPMSTVLSPADLFLRRVLLVTLLCVVLGGLAAWLYTRRLITPLRQLTAAADTLAAGGQLDSIPVARADELGSLATSFEAMARQIHEARQRLEEKVTERTSELNVALQQLQAAQEALVRREKLAMLGQLAGGVGHELRNPLGVMSNAIYYLEMVLESPPEDVREYLHLLREQVALSTRIVSDLLDFARATPAHRRATALGEVVVAQLQRLPAAPRVRIDVRLDGDLPMVDVDPLHIGQVVGNLVTNAVQAMGDAGGRITIEAEPVGGDDVALRITDSGPGVPPELIDQIFEPLFTTKARGIGLGLAVSRALMQANSGDITVCSDPGHGATFTLTMPAAAGVTT